MKPQNTDLISRNGTQYLLAVMSFVTDPCTFCATTKWFQQATCSAFKYILKRGGGKKNYT